MDLMNRLKILFRRSEYPYSDVADVLVRKVINQAEFVGVQGYYVDVVLTGNRLRFYSRKAEWYSDITECDDISAPDSVVMYTACRPSKKTLIAFWEWVDSHIIATVHEKY